MKTTASILCLFLASGLLQAQQLEPIQEIPPAPASADEIQPDITIRNRGGDRYEEYRINGQLYMIKITPKVGLPYYLVAREKDGGFVRTNDLDRAKMIAQWRIFSW